MDMSDAKRLRSLEEENRKLNKLLAERMLDQAALKELLSKNGRARAKREAVAHLRNALQMSERRACSLVGADCTMVRYRSRRPPEVELRKRFSMETYVDVYFCDPQSPRQRSSGENTKIIDAFWEKNGERPKTFTIDLAMRFLSIARETGCVDDAGCEELNRMREAMEEYRGTGLSDKNADLIRKVLTDGVWDRVVNLPAKLI